MKWIDDSTLEVDLVFAVWIKAKPVPNMDPARYRMDCYNFIIEYFRYGQEGEFGWGIDYVRDPEKGGEEIIDNYRPLHWENKKNRREMKAIMLAVKNQLAEARKAGVCSGG